MKREDHTALIQKIRASLPDGAELAPITEALTTLADDYGTVTAELESTKDNAGKMQKDIESLREVNMRLFLKVGGTEQSPAGNKKQEPERMKFEDLFNEKGGLK